MLIYDFKGQQNPQSYYEEKEQNIELAQSNMLIISIYIATWKEILSNINIKSTDLKKDNLTKRELMPFEKRVRTN